MTQFEASVRFRTLPRGGWKWVGPGQRRGYWRVILGPKGAVDLRTPGTWEVWRGHEGIQGVTARSRYCLEASQAAAERIAAEINRLILAHEPDKEDMRFLHMMISQALSSVAEVP